MSQWRSRVWPAFVGIGLTLSIIAMLVSVLSLMGKTLRERESVSWTENGDQDAQQQRDDFQETIENFSDHQSPVLLVIECDDFFRSDRWLAIESAVAQLEAHEDGYQLVWIGSLPEFSRSPDNVRMLETIPAPLRSALGPLIRQQHPVPNTNSPETVWRDFEDRVSSHPLVNGQLLSADRQTMLVQVYGWGFDEQSLQTVFAPPRATLASAGMRARITGPLPLYLAHRTAFDESHYRVLALAIFFAALFAVLIFRDLRSLLLVGIGPGLGTIWAIAIIRWLGEPSNELTDLILPVMLVMVGFADSIHLVVDMRHHKAIGLSPRQSVVAALRRVGPACLLTSITTSASFATLMFSDSSVISSFGRSSAIAILLSLIAILFTTPLIAVLIRGPGVSARQRRRALLGSEEEIQSHRLRYLLGLPSRYPRAISCVGFALFILAANFALRLSPDDRVRDRMPQRVEAWEAFQHCDQAFGGLRMIFAKIEWPQHSSEAEILEVINATERIFEEETLIAAPLSITNWLHAIPLPADAEPTLAMAELLPPDVNYRFWQPDQRATIVVARVRDLGLLAYDPVIEHVEDEFSQLETNFPGYDIQLQGEPILEARFVGHVIRGLFGSLATAACVIFVTLTIAFRSLRLGLISIVPNLLPLLLAASLRLFISPTLDIASACAFVIALGIAVDDTIHLVWRFELEAKQRPTIQEAIKHTVLGVGTPLTMTTLIMVVGLGTVTTSQLPPHQYFGWITSTTLIAAWICDLLLLPAMLAWLGGKDQVNEFAKEHQVAV